MNPCMAPAVIFREDWEDQVPKDAKRKMLDFGDLPCDHSGVVGMHCICPRACPFTIAVFNQARSVWTMDGEDDG